MNGPWITPEWMTEEKAAAAGLDQERNEILYVVTVGDLIDRYNELHESGPVMNGDGATWEGLTPERKLELIDKGAEYLTAFSNMEVGYTWAEYLGDAIAAVEGAEVTP